MNEIEQAAKEYAEKEGFILKNTDEYINCIKDFTAGAEFYKNALSQKFDGLREEFFEEFVSGHGYAHCETPEYLLNWFKEKMLK